MWKPKTNRIVARSAAFFTQCPASGNDIRSDERNPKHDSSIGGLRRFETPSRALQRSAARLRRSPTLASRGSKALGRRNFTPRSGSALTSATTAARSGGRVRLRVTLAASSTASRPKASITRWCRRACGARPALRSATTASWRARPAGGERTGRGAADSDLIQRYRFGDRRRIAPRSRSSPVRIALTNRSMICRPFIGDVRARSRPDGRDRHVRRLSGRRGN